VRRAGCAPRAGAGAARFVPLEVVGQSFMLHQIRKMVGAALAVQVSSVVREELLPLRGLLPLREELRELREEVRVLHRVHAGRTRLLYMWAAEKRQGRPGTASAAFM
jgi:tRNA U38,U39,U40 pseudouridine synthase TruA